MSPDATPEKNPLLILDCGKSRVVEAAQRDKYEGLPGARWKGRTKVHLAAGRHFVVDSDGKCRACRKGATCEALTVSILDISNVPRNRARAPRRWTPATRSTDQEEKTLLRELEDFTPELPKDLRDLINSTAWSDEGLRKLLAVARSRFVEYSDVKFEVIRTFEPDEGQPLGPSLWADPRGRAAVRKALLKGVGKPYDSFEEAARAGNVAQGLKQGRIERAIRELVAEERAGSK